jgi:hypothetical protein
MKSIYIYHTSKSLSHSQVAELRLDLHAEFICELSVAASKELAIEEAIAKIEEVWGTFELDMVEDKGVPASAVCQSFCSRLLIVSAIRRIEYV